MSINSKKSIHTPSIVAETQSIRLHKFISQAGVTSRRKAEHMIVQGKVSVNNETVTELGRKIVPTDDVVCVDGKLVDIESVEKIYVVFNKPRGCVTTLSDPEGRPTVMDYMHGINQRIFPVGRLDYLSEGLLLLTNDGDLANQIIHPSAEVTKVYEVKVFGAVTEKIMRVLREGLTLPEGPLRPLSVRVIQQLPQKTWLEFRISEGKNREIRKFCEAAGLTVDKLRRVSIGGLSIADLPYGKYQTISRKDLWQKIFTEGFDSHKKSVNIKKRIQKTHKADDKVYYKFRKQHYHTTIEKFKELKGGVISNFKRPPENAATIAPKLLEKDAKDVAANSFPPRRRIFKNNNRRN